jgi:Tfp pilus assembly protein PilN
MSNKPPNQNFVINLDLLKPQSNPEKALVRLIRWLLSSGRYVFIFVEAIVLIAFVARFKLDEDLASKKEAIEQQIPYIQSLKPYEIQIRQTQLKLSTIGSFYGNYPDYVKILKKIADQTPAGVKITSINMEKNASAIGIQLSAQAQNNNDLANFIEGLKQDNSFSDVEVNSVAFDKGTIIFSLTAQTKLGGTSL